METLLFTPDTPFEQVKQSIWFDFVGESNADQSSLIGQEQSTSGSVMNVPNCLTGIFLKKGTEEHELTEEIVRKYRKSQKGIKETNNITAADIATIGTLLIKTG